MKILGIDSSGLVASVAVVENGILQGEFTMNYKKTHSQTLLPMLDEMSQLIELDLNTIDAIAVAGGPGSFTGLRIGSATAKGLGLALNKPLIQIPTVDGLAYNCWGSSRLVCPLMDARRNQTYTGLYEFCKDELKIIIPQCAVPVTEILDQINNRTKEVVFLGDGVPVFKNIIQEYCRADYIFAPAHMAQQSAASVAALGVEYFAMNKVVSAADFQPDYLRLSQAERERQEKQSR